MAPITLDGIKAQIERFGQDRYKFVKEICKSVSDLPFGANFIVSIGTRESGLTNVISPNRSDFGWLQINRNSHPGFFANIHGCKHGTWEPISLKINLDNDQVPTLESSTRYAIDILRAAMRSAELNGVDPRHVLRFSVAAYNAGTSGALKGYREGNMDKYTTGGDYSYDVYTTRRRLVAAAVKELGW